jgi:tetratricopeptide (TPR) repeat protein
LAAVLGVDSTDTVGEAATMKWGDLLSRVKRHPRPAPAAQDISPSPAGIDYLMARASRTGPTDRPTTDAGRVRNERADANPLAEAISWETCLAAAEQAQERADWPEAEILWRTMRSRFPHIWFSYTGEAAASAALGRPDDARRLLAEATVRFPREHAIPAALGRLAMSLADWPAAEQHWRTALTFQVRPWWIYTELARAHERQGRLADAEAALLDGQADDPNEVSLFINHARLAWERHDWAAAVARWAEARRRFPLSEQLSSGLYQAVMRLAEWDPVAADRACQELGLASADAAPEDDRRALVLQFESLGGTGPAGGCEFGGVQREYGAEPLGLFRWATVSPASLIACLERRFEGIGDADSTTLFLHDDLWEIGDTTYGTSMHSFVSSKDVPSDRMLVLARNRMRYLKDKLIADLEEAAKIFVLKVQTHVTAAETEALSRALRSYGPGRLLCVCPADPAHSAGGIEPAAPGVFVGYLDFSGLLDVAPRRAEWEALCRKMLNLSSA